MGQELMYIGCGMALGVGLLFLVMGYVSGHYGDDTGAGCAWLIAAFLLIGALSAILIIGF